jgi:ubiquinone/menaquinone biosynthesis C-methylase UbiE
MTRADYQHINTGIARCFALCLCATCFSQVDYKYALTAAKATDFERERLQRASDIIDALVLKPGDSVADVGAGSGYYTGRLSPIVGSHGRVYAVDIRDVSIHLLQQRIESDHLDNVIIIHSTPNDPQLEPSSLDAVLIVDAYHEMDGHQIILEHIRTALRPGGRLVIADYSNRPDRNEPRSVQSRKHSFSPMFAVADMTAAGFVRIEIKDPLLRRKPEIRNSRIGEGDLWLVSGRRP